MIQHVHHKVKEKLNANQTKYKLIHEQHRVDHKFQEGDQVWLYLNKERLKGLAKQLKPLRYVPFESSM